MKRPYIFKSQLLPVAGLFLALILFGSSALATNGYFRHGYGTQYRSLAGAGAALYLGPLGVATNPAGMAFLGSQLDVGFSLFNPNRDYTVSGNPSGFPGTFPLAPGMIESDSKLFFVPNLGLNYALPGANHALNLAVYGNGGMNTDYNTKTFNNPQLSFDPPTGVDLSQLFVAASYAREIVPKHALGITGIFSYQRFRAEGLFAFAGFSSDPGKLTNNDHDASTGFGARVGYLGEWLPALSVGLSYQTKISMSEFEEYAGLFAGGGDFDIPANWTAGVALKPTPELTLAVDVQQIFYSDVSSVGNPLDLQNNPPAFPDGSPNANFQPLGSEESWGFGWEDMTVIKFGLQYALSPATHLRGGFSLTDQPIPESEVLFNILAPGVVEQHLTLGLSQRLSPKITLNLSFMHAFANSVNGPNPFEAPNQQQIELDMNEYEGDLGISIAL